jgi:uncharacterized protein (UPF0335 family)
MNISADALRNHIEKIERLDDKRLEILADVKDCFTAAVSEGFDVKTMKELIKLRKLKKEEIVERQDLLNTYMVAIGMS